MPIDSPKPENYTKVEGYAFPQYALSVFLRTQPFLTHLQADLLAERICMKFVDSPKQLASKECIHEKTFITSMGIPCCSNCYKLNPEVQIKQTVLDKTALEIEAKSYCDQWYKDVDEHDEKLGSICGFIWERILPKFSKQTGLVALDAIKMKSTIKHLDDCNVNLDDESDMVLNDYQTCTCGRDKFIDEICAKFGVGKVVSVEEIFHCISNITREEAHGANKYPELRPNMRHKIATAIHKLLMKEE